MMASGKHEDAYIVVQYTLNSLDMLLADNDIYRGKNAFVVGDLVGKPCEESRSDLIS
jgi:hypothetical protein